MLFAGLLTAAGGFGGIKVWNLVIFTANPSLKATITQETPNNLDNTDQSPAISPTQDIANNIDAQNVEDLKSWQLGLLALVAILYLWALRIFAKLFFSQVHLAIDASERVTLIQAYIAMLADPSSGADIGREIVLANIFRSTASGIVSDDGMPPTLLTEATKVASGSR